MGAAPWINENTATLPSAVTRNGRTRGTVSTAPRTTRILLVLKHMLAFTVMAYLLYGVVTILGRSLEASAVSQRQRMEVRTAGARTDVIELGRQVTSLVSVESLDKWAQSHGYFRPGLTKNSRADEQTSKTI